MKKEVLNWRNTVFLILSPLIGILGTAFYVCFNGVRPFEIVLFASYYLLTGLAVTAGYHRYFAHRSYESNFLLRLFFLIFGACALENTVLCWASDHRLHHKHVDTDQDPYNIKRGGWYAHIGWIFFDTSHRPMADNVRDLKEDPLVLWQEKYYILIAVVAGFLAPALIGLAMGRPLGGLLWGGFFRVVFVHHMTFFINSLAHMFGKQTYSNRDSSRDSAWIALLTYGEGYHNFHHTFQADYRNGIRWYHWDPSKWMIALCRWLGMARRLNRTPVQKILKARMEMEILRTKFGWRNALDQMSLGAVRTVWNSPEESRS